MNFHDAVERLRALPESLVDIGYQEGRDAIARQLSLRAGRDESGEADNFIEECKEEVSTLIQRCAPYVVPEDYIAFLSEVGGFVIDNDSGRFATLGIGPMVEEWYSSIASDQAIHEPGGVGFLMLGSLRFRLDSSLKNKQVKFLLNISGKLARGKVIGVGPLGEFNESTLTQLNKHSKLWRIIANSFTEFVRLAAETNGLFGYLK